MARQALRLMHVAATVAIAALLVGQSRMTAQGRIPRVRIIGSDITTPIEKRLLPDDEVVELRRKISGATLYVLPDRRLTKDQAVQIAARDVDLVVVIRALSATPFLAENDSWVHTRVEGVVSEVLRNTRDEKVTSGDRLKFSLIGGQIKLGTVIVRTHNFPPEGFKEISLNEQYLLFLHDIEGDWQPDHPPLLVRGGRLTYFGRYVLPGQLTNPMEGSRYDDVARLVRGVKVPRDH